MDENTIIGIALDSVKPGEFVRLANQGTFEFYPSGSIYLKKVTEAKNEVLTLDGLTVPLIEI